MTHTHRHTDHLLIGSSRVFLHPREYKNFTRNNRFTEDVDYTRYQHGMWEVVFNKNISLTQFTMMIGLIEYR